MHADPDDPCAVNSLVETPGCSPVEGRVVWDPVHSLWNGAMLAVALVLGPLTVSPSAIAVFAVTTDGGKFELKGLPPGTYTVETWHEKAGTKTQQVTIGPKESKEIGFTYRAADSAN